MIRVSRPPVAAHVEAGPYERVLPGVWRWADPDGSARCGTGLAAADGLVFVDPPAVPAAARRDMEASAGPIRHVVLTSARHAALAAPYRGAGATVWAPQPRASIGAAAEDGRGAAQSGTGDGRTGARGGAEGQVAPEVDRRFGFDDRLPGGLVVCQLPAHAAPGSAPDSEVALLWPNAGGGLLMVGDVLPVCGQTPVYREGEAPPISAYLDALKALLAAEPGTLAPAHHAPPEAQVIRATGWAAQVGSPLHARRAAPVVGPRYLVPQAVRVLEEALAAPVIVRRARVDGRPVVERSGEAAGGSGVQRAAREEDEAPWTADPFACARCGRPNVPLPATCSGPPIARLCPDCRAERRRELPAARVMICAGGCCTREGARAVLSAARQAAAARGLADTVDVVPVSCLGECSLGPFVHVAAGRGGEPAFARAFRERTVERARRYAAAEGEVIDDESELVLSRFAALAQPDEAAALIDRLASEPAQG